MHLPRGRGHRIEAVPDFLAGGEFILNRHYSKALTHVSGFGPGWTWSFGDYLALSSPTPNFAYICKYEHPACMTPRYQVITWHRADGRTYTYTWDDATWSYVDSRPEARSAFSFSTTDSRDPQAYTYTILTEDREYRTYNASGQPILSRNIRNLGYDYSYTGGQLTTITHTSGRALTLGWSGGRIASITAPNDKTFAYGYTGGRLTSVTYPDSLGTRSYHYEDANHPNGLTGYSIDGVRKTRYAYYTNGKVKWSGLEGGAERDT